MTNSRHAHDSNMDYTEQKKCFSYLVFLSRFQSKYKTCLKSRSIYWSSKMPSDMMSCFLGK